jgi:phosphoribosylaminoimidazole carboxylase (NCAIR synthetase)
MSTVLGIVGGGQLALYLCEAAQRLGVIATGDAQLRERLRAYKVGLRDAVLKKSAKLREENAN